ncbi:MAG: hypothetical protein OEV42_03875 [Deltaproteobacteria bacterium]|nr:hypothetical protein [Deltaproteobacteria bacterium]
MSYHGYHGHHPCHSPYPVQTGGLAGIAGGLTSLASSFIYGGSSLVKNIVDSAIWGDPRCGGSHSYHHSGHHGHHGCSSHCCDQHCYTVDCYPPHHERCGCSCCC